MKLKSILISLLLTNLPNIAFADIEDAYDSYQAGYLIDAVEEFSMLSEQGDAHAQYNLGVMYSHGRGVTKDDVEATKWYKRAAEQGITHAQYNLGVRYDNGKGVLKDYKEAAKWYERAADQGNDSEAQYKLGAMYALGRGVTKDMTLAKFWLKKSYENKKSSEEIKINSKKMWDELKLWKH